MRLSKTIDLIIAVVALAMVAYHLTNTHILIVGPLEHLSIHLTFSLLLIFLLGLKEAQRSSALMVLLILASLVLGVYVFRNCDEMPMRGVFLPIADVIIGSLAIILTFEATRRAFGVVIPIVALVSIIYVFAGQYLPGIFHVSEFSLREILYRMVTGMEEGIYGSILGISANALFLFMIFGAMLQVTSATNFFIQVGRVVCRKFAGGAGLAAVISSTLMGMATGSVSANAATIGPFTIPLMKRAGYKPVHAAAIEGASSVGGQIMPPIMGATAFIMPNFCGIPYSRIMVVALVPALLYYFSIALYVQFQALKFGLRPPSEEVDRRELFLSAPLFILPLGLLVVLLLQAHSLGYSVSFSIGLVFLLSLFRKKTRPSLPALVQGLIQGAILGAQLAVTCALLGVMMSAVEFTGLVIMLPASVESLSMGHLFIGLVLAMLVSILLGGPLITTAVYVLVAVLVVPGLIRMGVPILAAHFFSFYYAVMASLTPPEALGAMITSKIAGVGYMETSVECTKVGVAGFIVPFLFVWCPTLLLQPTEPLWAVVGSISSITVIIAAQVAICNWYLQRIFAWERAGFTAVVILLLVGLATKTYVLLAIGVGFFIALTAGQLRRKQLTGNRSAMASEEVNLQTHQGIKRKFGE